VTYPSGSSSHLVADTYLEGQMLRNFYRSCFTPCPQTGEAFAVDAIISNPPAFAHIHVAEALGVPLTMSFSTSTPDGYAMIPD
jgi:hypothetical protein